MGRSVDLRSGKVWGFPTGTLDPYHSNPLDSKPLNSRAFSPGKFAFEDTDKWTPLQSDGAAGDW
jgi:hypothetical protein